MKLSYPANWTKQESNLEPYQVVVFHTPTRYSYDLPNASVEFYALGGRTNQTLEEDRLMLEEFVSDSSYGAESKTRLVNSSYVTLSGGILAYQDVYYDYNNNKNLKVLYLKTVISAELFQILYTAQPAEFSRYLPTVQKMIDSFKTT